MMVFSPALTAQIGAELKMRLRSFAPPIAMLVFFAGAVFWIPDPKSNSATLTWTLADGRIQSPVYTAGYVGFGVAVLSCIFLSLGGFYLVAGSVRRDRQSNVGAILAATPLSKTAYLGGKLAAHLVYLFALSLLALVAGLIAFVRFGVGPFSPVDFALPYFVLTVPAIAAVASLAVLFDVTPVLSSRGGLALFFFVFLFGLIKLPLDLSGAEIDDPAAAARRPMSLPIYDPAGLASDQWLVRNSLPPHVGGVSTGHVTHEKGIERVPWKGLEITPQLVALRALNLAFCVIPFGAAILIFDRFDPSRRRRRTRRPGLFNRIRERVRGTTHVTDAPEMTSRAVVLTPVSPNPTAARAVLAEARLIWESASWIKWPLAVAALLAGLTPGNLSQGVFLLLLVPVISEVAAREDLAATRALIWSQPGVPSSTPLWKAAALALFLLMLGAPMTIHGFAESTARGAACVIGMLAVALLSAGLSSLSSGGKLFSGVYLAVWYMALSGLPEADFSGALSKTPSLAVVLAYLGIGAILVAAAAGRERLRRA
jgi:hypothetical protein